MKLPKKREVTCPSRIDGHRGVRCQESFGDELEFCSSRCSYPCVDCSWVDKCRSSDSDDCDDGRHCCRPSRDGREYF